jgi:hypothetical protein
MTIRTFWTIFIKILGIWLVLDCLTVVPQFFSTILFTKSDTDMLTTLMWLGAMLVTFVFYFLVLRIFVFKTNWIIDKLNLDKNFTEEKIDLNISSQTVLRIATLIVGGFILVESLPSLCKELFSFYQQKSIMREYPSTGWIIYHFIKSLIGYLLLTNSKTIVEFINKQTKEKQPE